MPIVLGIHNGHHASCAVVRDGVLIAAIQQERITRIKNDGQEGLSNRLPIHECLEVAGVSFDEVDSIVSSFQAASPGGTGLHRPLIERGFNLFDPWDTKHIVISHHYAHGLSALGTSGFRNAAVLICDLGGSTTCDGIDFMHRFSEFEHKLTSPTMQSKTLTECLSIYQADEVSFELKYREYCIPHNTPDVFVQNVASLYDNVSRLIFRKENAHGQLMALASMVADKDDLSNIKASDIVTIALDDSIHFRNDWQNLVAYYETVLDYAPLANQVQHALQNVLLQYVSKTRKLTSSQRLVAAGGVFLNILANSEISQSKLFEEYYVPSSPHDAGISIGCAYAGWRNLTKHHSTIVLKKAIDRLGPSYSVQEVDKILSRNAHLIEVVRDVSPLMIARLLEEGQIIARCAGRSELGPRALGGRSLLGSPLLASTKDRLNAIKGRQAWRPVAPIIQRKRVQDFFDGPDDSPYMNFVHVILKQYRDSLLALSHPDGSTRAQTLEQTDDPYLYAVLSEFERLTGFPIIVNTSLNGPGEPIVETPEQGLEFFITHPNVDGLLLGDQLVRRSAKPSWKNTRLAPDTIISIIYPLGKKRIILIRRGVSLEISQATLDLIERHQTIDIVKETELSVPQDYVVNELVEAVRYGLLVQG